MIGLLRGSSSGDKGDPRASVYEESISMLAGALLVYLFADIRDMAREQEISTSLADLEPPLTAEEVLERIGGNEEALTKRAIDHDDLKKRLDAFKSLKQHEGSFFSKLFSPRNDGKVVMSHFVDTNANEEMVHSIVVNEPRKRVTVIFRGSVTTKDFMQDAKCAQKKIKNPVAELVENEELTTEDIRVHTGFYEYLFKVNTDTEKTRLEEMIEEVKDCFRSNPGFDLYCCGHSLGGALSTLFSFFAASDNDLMSFLTRPLCVYSIASPYVGNWKFRSAFQHLERTKRIQHLRIANLEDMVTLLPFATPKLTALSPALSLVMGAGNLYKHCGIRLQMVAEPKEGMEYPFTISYPKDHECDDEEEYEKEVNDAMISGKSLTSAFFLLLKKDVDRIVKFHSCEEYEARLERCKPALTDVTLDEIYSDRSIVGNILDKDFTPRKMDSGLMRAKRLFGYWRTSKKSASTESAD